MAGLRVVDFEPLVTYEVAVGKLTITMGNEEFDASLLLENGRASYILFEHYVREKLGLLPTTGSDHGDLQGLKYEQKSYVDEALSDKDLFHTASSSTFGANNHGPTIKKMLLEGRYDEAKALVLSLGPDKNDFYVYTNTGRFDRARTNLKITVVPKDLVVENLDKSDPRLISRATILGLATRVEKLV